MKQLELSLSPVGIQSGTAILTDSLVVSTKLKVFLPHDLAVAHHGTYLKELKTWSTQKPTQMGLQKLYS